MPKELSYLEAIREALVEEMRRDPNVFVLGEDVGPYGGAFGVTQGLWEEFGEARVLDTPISESAIVGVSIGAALRGYRPVAEMQFADFISCGFDQIVNQAATLHYRCARRARDACDVSGYTPPVFPGARAIQPSQRRQNCRSAAAARRILESGGS